MQVKIICFLAILFVSALGQTDASRFPVAAVSDDVQAEARADVVDDYAGAKIIQEDRAISGNEEFKVAVPIDAITILPRKCYTKRGLTWLLASHDCANGMDNVSCAGCNPYSGDTICAAVLPILCIYKAKMPRPGYAVTCSAHAMPKEFYCGWSGAYLKVSRPVRGCTIASKADADKRCQNEFGSCWQMASHGDGYYMPGMNLTVGAHCAWNWSTALSGGWAFYGFGNIGATTQSRFWTYINNQPGNCWN